MTTDLCAAFDVGESTVHAKARAIEKAIGVGPFDPQWTLPSLVEKNPLFWNAEVNGLWSIRETCPGTSRNLPFKTDRFPTFLLIAKRDYERKGRRGSRYDDGGSIS